MFETFLSNAGTTVRSETLNGRQYTVVPMSLIVPGVLNGSRGPLYYPPDEITRSRDAWNGMPIVVNHPTDLSGQPVSARDPKVLEQYQIGFVYRATYKDKLVAEGWFDDELTKNRAPDLWDKVQRRAAFELSTGLYTRNDESAGTYNGRTYTHVARDYRPDHLAVLTHEIGACSVRDGCGVLVNSEDDDIGYPPGGDGKCPHCGMAHNAKPTGAVCNGCGKAMRKKKSATTNLEANMNKAELVSWLTTNCDCWKGKDDAETLNKMSEEKLKTLKDVAEKAKKDAADLVTANAAIKTNEPILNAAKAGFKDGEVQYVFNAQTGQFTKVNTTPTPSSTPPTPPKPQTAEEWFASAPPPVQEAVRNAADIVAKERNSLIEKLTANQTDATAKANLVTAYQKVDLPTLRLMVNALPATTTPPQQTKAPPSFFGAGGGSQVTNTGGNEPVESLPLPTINYEEFCSPALAAYLKNR